MSNKPRRLRYIADADDPVHRFGAVRRLRQPHRWEKDILRVGKWYVPNEDTGRMEPWEVTEDMLHEIAENFDRGIVNGADCPTVWDHSDSAKDRNGRVESCFVRNGTLFARFSAFGENIEERIENSGGVSPEIRESFMDGAGNKYGLMLTHLGIVSHPVVTGQGPFRRLSLKRNMSMAGTATKGGKTQTKKSNVGTGERTTEDQDEERWVTRQLSNGKAFVRRLAAGEDAAPDEKPTKKPESGSGGEGEEETYPEIDEASASIIIDFINESEAENEDGIPLPAGTNGKNLVRNIKIIASIKEQKNSDDEEEEGSEGASEEGHSMPDIVPEQIAPQYMNQLSNQGGTGQGKKRRLSAIELENVALKAKLESRDKADEKARKLSLQNAEVAFKTRVEELCGEFKVVSAQKDDIVEMGRAGSWKLSLLKPFEDLKPAVNTESKTRRFSNSKSDGAPKQMSRREATELGRRLAGAKPKKKEE